jgi:hypothetical protein
MVSESLQDALIEIVKARLLSGVATEIPGLGTFDTVHRVAEFRELDADESSGNSDRAFSSVLPPGVAIRFAPAQAPTGDTR